MISLLAISCHRTPRTAYHVATNMIADSISGHCFLAIQGSSQEEAFAGCSRFLLTPKRVEMVGGEHRGGEATVGVGPAGV